MGSEQKLIYSPSNSSVFHYVSVYMYMTEWSGLTRAWQSQ